MSTRGDWRSAQDPKSGRTYYYNSSTKETTWSKPLCLASPEERDEMIRLDREKRAFFHEMECNMKKKWAKAQELQDKSILSGSPVLNFMSEDEYHALFAGMDSGRRRLSSVGGAVPRRIRTISTIDDAILVSMRHAESKQAPPVVKIAPPLASSHSGGTGDATGGGSELLRRINGTADAKVHSDSPIDQGRRIRTGSLDHPDEMPLPMNVEAKDVQEANAMSHVAGTDRKLVRRNSTVIRAHMLDAAKEQVVPHPDFDVFKDKLSSPKRAPAVQFDTVPSLTEVKDFFNALFKKSQLESDCIIMALIYCERLVKETKGRLCIRCDNWKSILFACLVMASKVWDDLSMWNVDFSQAISGFDLQRVNDLELAMLAALKYVIRVSASEYAKYYFHLRSMSARLDLSNCSATIAPLDMSGARRLQLATEQYELSSSGGSGRTGGGAGATGVAGARKADDVERASRRHSLDVAGVNMGAGGNAVSRANLHRQASDNTAAQHHGAKQVTLEQLVHSGHNDASGAPKPASSKVNSPKNGTVQTGLRAADAKSTPAMAGTAADALVGSDGGSTSRPDSKMSRK